MSVTAPAPAASRPTRSLRWLRAAIPFAVLIAIWLGVGLAHAIEEPDLDDPGTLSPQGTGPHGSSRLAELLRAKGITIDRVTSSAEARALAGETESTVFVPTPDFLNPAFFATIASNASVQRVVVVQPGLLTAFFAGLPVYPTGDRWVTATAAADCAVRPIGSIGRAAVRDNSYVVDRTFEQVRTSMACYHGSVTGARWLNNEMVFVGANDLFRNDRIGELANAELATSLLSGTKRIIWVDVHQTEPRPKATAPSITLPDYHRNDQDRTDTGFPLIDAFPSWLWAGVLLALVAAVLLAIARARRLGPPVAEPLPVIVPAAEAVTGRGRLYERIGAREATLETLRGAAINRIAPVLNPFGTRRSDRELGRFGSGADWLVTQIARRTRSNEHAVRETLYGPPPADDAELARAAANLDALVAAVLSHDVPAVPSQDLPTAVPSQGLPTAVPSQDLPTAGPDQQTPIAIPSQHRPPEQFRGGNP